MLLEIRYDLVDLTRQVLQVNFSLTYKQMVTAFKDRDIETFELTSNQLLDILVDLEQVLQTDRHFLLENWIRDAKANANDDEVNN